MVIHISPKRIFTFLIGVSSALVLLHILGQVSRLAFGHGQLFGLVALFSLEEETNVPSFWSSFLWLIAALTAGATAYLSRNAARRDWPHWTGLAAIFYLFAMDETIQFHERLGGLFAKLLRLQGLHASGILYYVWIVPALLFAGVVFFAYARFLLKLPRGVMLLFVAAGVIFITGSVGFELLEGPIDEAGGYMNLLYTTYVTCEEAFEMAGVCLLILGLMRYAAIVSPAVQVAVSDTVSPLPLQVSSDD